MAVKDQYQQLVMLSAQWVNTNNLKQALNEMSLPQNDQLILSSRCYQSSREVFRLIEQHLTAK
jgi:hypothetical protein